MYWNGRAQCFNFLREGGGFVPMHTIAGQTAIEREGLVCSIPNVLDMTFDMEADCIECFQYLSGITDGARSQNPPEGPCDAVLPATKVPRTERENEQPPASSGAQAAPARSAEAQAPIMVNGTDSDSGEEAAARGGAAGRVLL